MTRLGCPDTRCPQLTSGALPLTSSCRGQRLGELLLFHFLKTAFDVADRIGIFAVDLFSKDDGAKRFYLKYGFIPPCRTTFSISICRWQLFGRCSLRRRQNR